MKCFSRIFLMDPFKEIHKGEELKVLFSLQKSLCLFQT
jgi:hypothetical protein